MNTFGYIVPLAFWTVLIAELVGDKSMYLLTSLTLRFRAGLVFLAFAIACGAKMLVAVLLSSALLRLQSNWTYAVSGIAFLFSAILIWTEKPKIVSEEGPSPGWARGVLACFATFFLTEWCDPGQISAAALVLKSHLVLGTWLGATLAILAKGIFAMTIGFHIRGHLSRRVLRLVASTSCGILGLLALGQSMLH